MGREVKTEEDVYFRLMLILNEENSGGGGGSRPHESSRVFLQQSARNPVSHLLQLGLLLRELLRRWLVLHHVLEPVLTYRHEIRP